MSDKVKKCLEKPPSEDFVNLVTTNSGLERECYCGRVCFEDDEGAGDWESGELEALREHAKRDPEKYISFTTGMVRAGTIDGAEFVTNCPCNLLSKYEKFIWSHRVLIMEYLQKRTHDIASRAVSDEGMAELVTDSVAGADKDIDFAKCQDCGGYFDRDSLNLLAFCSRCAQTRRDKARGCVPAEQNRPSPFGMDEDENLPFCFLNKLSSDSL